MRVMGHRGKDMISPKEVMVDHKWSPLSDSPDRGRHLQTHLECLKHCLETFQSFGRPLPPLLLTDNFQVHLGDPPLASQQNDFSRQQNHAGQMLQGLQTCPHYERFLMRNSMMIMRVMICWTWVGRKAKPKSAWSKWNSPWSNLPKGWGSPALVHSTGAREYGGWVSREEAWVHYPRTKPFESAARWTPALVDGGWRFFGDFREVAALGKLQ